MIKPISKEVWGQYSTLLSAKRKIYEPALPVNLQYNGKIEAGIDYVPPEEILTVFKGWLNEQNEVSVYYFLTESVEGEQTDFEISVSELNSGVLLGINKGGENVITAKDFAWAIFIDHEGVIHIAGSKSLFSILNTIFE